MYKIFHLISGRMVIADIEERGDYYICYKPYFIDSASTIGAYLFDQIIPFSVSGEIQIKKDKIVFEIDNLNPLLIEMYQKYHLLTIRNNEVLMSAILDDSVQKESLDTLVKKKNFH